MATSHSRLEESTEMSGKDVVGQPLNLLQLCDNPNAIRSERHRFPQAIKANPNSTQPHVAFIPILATTTPQTSPSQHHRQYHTRLRCCCLSLVQLPSFCAHLSSSAWRRSQQGLPQPSDKTEMFEVLGCIVWNLQCAAFGLFGRYQAL